MDAVSYILEIIMPDFIAELNIGLECKRQFLKLWQCPPFLVLVWGTVTIIIIVATYLVAKNYSSEEIVIASVSLVAIISFVVGGLNIAAFNRLAEANQMKSEFISITSHQLRSPLSIFKWTLDVIENEFKKGDGINSLESHIPTLRNTAENMIKLVNSILAVSRIDSRRLALKKEPISLAALTSETIAGFRAYAEAFKTEILLNAAADLPEIMADKEYLGMAIYNLMDNAIRYSGGGRTVTVAIEMKGDEIRWSVQDQGIGIPKTQQKYIFQKFFRAESDAKYKTAGSGIGLYIAKAIIESSGGKIGFSSTEGKGSIFRFSLPVTTPSKNG